MSHLSRLALVLSIAFSAAWLPLHGASPKPPPVPAKIAVEVAPAAVVAGETSRVTVQLEPIAGVQINRYPLITLKLAGRTGLVHPVEAAVGNSSPPQPGKLDANYFERVDPLELELVTDGAAPQGKHKLTGELTYFYCVKASGFCAPKKTSIEIPLEIR